ncbi:hypothetical protein ABBQ32_004709 [Trebouxia sp. C0010 RCD-2024]
MGFRDRIVTIFRFLADQPEAKTLIQAAQFASTLLFVVLYIWSTYSPPPLWSLRYNLDLFLCIMFAIDYISRLLDAESKVRMMTSMWSMLDFCAFAPPLVEALLMHGARLPFKLGRFDFRWFKILRALRVMRISLLAGELQAMRLSSSGALLSGAASSRLFQLVTSVLTLLFTTSSIVHLVERIPWHEALYFVTTTLTTVGFGDMVPITFVGRFAVLVMICIGVVLIPVQASQVYTQLQARRVTLGPMPDKHMPTVLASTRLTEVRGFSDFCSEFFQALEESGLPKKLRMVVMCNKPSFEFRAFQELNEKRVTLMEGTALSERDLQRSRAESASAVFLLADRFSSNYQQEDLNVQFQVWAVKGYTKSVPLYIQVLQRNSLQLIAPFLDPEHDVIVSMEQTRHRLLALSCLCPGASTLIANLLRTANVSPTDSRRRVAAGRRWLRSYINGCGSKVWKAPLHASLQGKTFSEAAEWAYRSAGFVLIGLMQGKTVMANPGRRRLAGSEQGVVVGTSQEAVTAAMQVPYTHPPPLEQASSVHEEAKTRLETLEDDDDYYLWDEGGRPCVPAPGARLDEAVQDVLCVPEWQEEGIPTKSKEEFQSQVARHREAHTLVPRQLTVPDSERLARKKKRRRRRWERQQRAAAQQPARFLEGYAAVPYPVAMLAPSFASKTGTESYDDEEDYILDEESSSDESGDEQDGEEQEEGAGRMPSSRISTSMVKQATAHLHRDGRAIYNQSYEEVVLQVSDNNGMPIDPTSPLSDLAQSIAQHDEPPHPEPHPFSTPSGPSSTDSSSANKRPGISNRVESSFWEAARMDSIQEGEQAKQNKKQQQTPPLQTLALDDSDLPPSVSADPPPQGAGEDDPRKADMLAADRYFSGDDDVGWERGAPPRPAPGSTATSPPEGVSSSTIVSGLVASRKQDHAVRGAEKIAELRNHVIVCGAEESFHNFIEQLHRCDPLRPPVVILHPKLPKSWSVLQSMFHPLHFVQGEPSNSASLRGARAAEARALVFLGAAQRPMMEAKEPGDAGDDGYLSSSRAAVLADAEALLTCYGVGEESGAELLHAVVELCFTSSVRFLQPGLLLKGNNKAEEHGPKIKNEPRRSWLMRKRQERAAMKEGLAEWQANPYFCAGRVTVPALMDTVACQCFINTGMLTDLLTEFAGDDGRPGGALLRQIALPQEMIGHTYGELVQRLTLHRRLVPLGLYRRKSENAAWRLQYVYTNPTWSERLEVSDRVFVLRERGGPWMTS